MNRMILESIQNAEAVLYVTEDREYRMFGSKEQVGRDSGPGGMVNRYDWKVWSGTGYGQQVASNLAIGRKGYEFEVSDFGCAVVIRALYHSTATGKGVEKTYVVIFDDPKSGNGTIFSTSTKWRSVSSASQAASYVLSSIQSYASAATSV